MNATRRDSRNTLACRLLRSESPGLIEPCRTREMRAEPVREPIFNCNALRLTKRRLTYFRIVSLLVLSSAMLLPFVSTLAEEPAKADSRDETMKYMEGQFRAMTVHIQAESDEMVELEPIAQPLLRFSDPARESSDGTLWAWGKTGRPLAIVAMERGETRWTRALVSLRTKDSPKISVTTGEGWNWSPNEPGLEFQPFPNAPDSVAEGKRRRLLTMKQLARRFDLMESWLGEEYKLRLLPQPVYRYSHAEEGLVDGAFFVFAHGTNPEALLLIECSPDSTLPWSYAFAPAADAKLVASLDGREVWIKPRRREPPNSQTPYSIVRR